MYIYFKSLIVIGLVAFLSACGGSASTTDSGNGNQQLNETEILSTAVDNYVAHYTVVQADLEQLAQRNQLLCETLDFETSTEAQIHAALAATQAQWRATNQGVQTANAFVFGASQEQQDGVGLAARLDDVDAIFAKQASFCSIDAQVAIYGQNPDVYSIDAAPTLARGIHSVERLLYEQSYHHACPDSTQVTQGWDDLELQERLQQRCGYNQLVIADMQAANQSILDLWTTGAYASQFFATGNIDQSLQDLFESLFYIETVKDDKLCLPRENASCDLANFDFVSAGMSQTTYAEITANLESLKAVYTGGEGVGFDDMMAAKGAQSSSDAFIAALDDALSLIQSQPDSLQQDTLALQSLLTAETESGATQSACENSIASPDVEAAADYQPCRIFGYLKQATDILITDVQSTLDLTVPDSVQGDGD